MYATRSDVDQLSNISPQFSLANPIVWHVGISPGFPSSLLLSDNTAVETVLSSIPLISVGILGFAVVTFFFFLHKLKYASAPVFVSILAGFIASVLDVGQLLIRGSTATDADTKVNIVLAYLVAREVFLALSISFRFLYYFIFTSLPPFGEKVRRRQRQSVPLNFLRMDSSDSHSADWRRWGVFGFVFKNVLLAATIAFTVLQLLWRLVARFSNFGGIYRSDVILEIALTAVFILKLLSNAWISPLRPRWKTVRNYSPIIIALLFRLTVAIGDIIQFQFSESTLGRFLQALELYTLVLYLLVASFYRQSLRDSMLDMSEEEPLEATAPLDQADAKSPNKAFSFPPKEKFHIPSKPSTRLSSWLMEVNHSRTTATDATSTRRTSSWLAGVRSSESDIERGKLPQDEVTDLAVSKTNPSKGPFSEQRDEQQATRPYVERLEQTGAELNLVSTTQKSDSQAPKGILKTADNTSVPADVSLMRTSEAPDQSTYSARIVPSYYVPSTETSSVRSSSSMTSLLRQQAELDKSVAELQLFRESMVITESTNTKRAIESFKSDFSLSNFPRPPSEMGSRYSLERLGPPSTIQGVPDVRFSGRPLSFPSAMRASNGSSLLGPGERAVVNGSGTQYDVTSFIGGLSVPIPKQSAVSPAPSIKADDSGSAKIGVAKVVPLPRSTPVVRTGQALNTLTTRAPPRMKPGLPSGVRLKISNPIPAANTQTETAYERPRRVPAT